MKERINLNSLKCDLRVGVAFYPGNDEHRLFCEYVVVPL